MDKLNIGHVYCEKPLSCELTVPVNAKNSLLLWKLIISIDNSYLIIYIC